MTKEGFINASPELRSQVIATHYGAIARKLRMVAHDLNVISGFMQLLPGLNSDHSPAIDLEIFTDEYTDFTESSDDAMEAVVANAQQIMILTKTTLNHAKPTSDQSKGISDGRDKTRPLW